MAAATQSAPVSAPTPIKSVQQNSEALQKIFSVPVVADSLKLAQSTIDSHPLIANTYHVGENLVNTGLKAAQPITARLHPQIAYVDHLAAQSLAFAESKWAYPFQATPEQLYKDAKAPAEQARALVAQYYEAIHKAYGTHVKEPAQSVYDARVAPAVGSASKQFEELKSQNAYVQRAVDAVSQLQSNLQKTLDSVATRGKENGDRAQKEAQSISNAIFSELERVRGFALSLPAESRKRFNPVLGTFTEAYETLSREVRNTNAPATERLHNVVKYVREQSLPALQKAIISPEEQSEKPAIVNGSS